MRKKEKKVVWRLQRIEKKCDLIISYLVEKTNERENELDSLIGQMRDTARNMKNTKATGYGDN